jgi:hypothetical protein
MEPLIREPAEIELNPNNMNWEDGFPLHISFKPFIHSLKGKKSSRWLLGTKQSHSNTSHHTCQPHLCPPKHGLWKGSFTSSPFTSVHLYIPHCWPLRGPFLELTPICSYQPYPSRPPIALLG